MIIVTSLKGEYTEALKTAVPLADTRPGLTEFKKHVHSLLLFFFKQTLDSFPLHKNSADDFF